MNGLDDTLRQIPITVWLGMLAAGVLLAALGRKRRPKIYARPDRGARFTRALWRAVSGAHMDGELRTNAGWWTSGAEDLTKNQKAPKWAYLPRGVRMLVRWVVTAALVAWVWGYITDSGITGVITIVALVVLVAWLAVKVVRAQRKARWRAKYLVPIHNALAEELGWDPKTTKPEDWVNMPRELGRNYTQPIVLLAPKGFSGSPDERYRIGSVVAQTIGADPAALETLYHDAGGEKPRISFTQYVDHLNDGTIGRQGASRERGA